MIDQKLTLILNPRSHIKSFDWNSSNKLINEIYQTFRDRFRSVSYLFPFISPLLIILRRVLSCLVWKHSTAVKISKRTWNYQFQPKAQQIRRFTESWCENNSVWVRRSWVPRGSSTAWCRRNKSFFITRYRYKLLIIIIIYKYQTQLSIPTYMNNICS